MGHPAPALSFRTPYAFGITEEDHSFFSARPLTSSRIEIVYIKEGSGFFIAGDQRTALCAGDIIMTGTTLCHQYKLDMRYMQELRGCVRVCVIRFRPDFWGDTFLNLHENGPIKILLENADRGIMPDADNRGTIQALMMRMLRAEGAGRIILLLEILSALSTSSGLRYLTTGRTTLHVAAAERLERVHQYSREHFARKIALEEIAAIAYVSPNSFCRWFKMHTKKTFSRYLIELRVRHACHLLTENRHTAKKICSDSGFNTVSNFHKCFREVMGKSPMEYQRELRGVIR
ncbi:MAG: helix-turn-helix domain-containing protein [Bacteroidetes bacterium]|nr:helix-turn-helix domain-containing protein [Bacteroidota bacterium]